MATDLLTWVCEKLTNNAPHAANGLADFVADRVLRRFVVLAELESITEADPEDVRLYIREAYTLEGEALSQLTTVSNYRWPLPAVGCGKQARGDRRLDQGRRLGGKGK